MRISTNYQYDSLQFDIQNAQSRLARLTLRLSSGKRIDDPSDDPTGVSQAISMRSLRSQMDQFAANLKTAKAGLGTTESTLSDLNSMLQSAYQIGVGGANGAMDQAGRSAMADQIASIQARMVELANAQGPTGKYLFAGQKTTTKPYAVVANALVYSGDANSVSVEAGPGRRLPIGVPGEPLFSTTYASLEQLKNDLAGGQIGAISTTDLAQIQSALKDVGAIRGDLGSRLAEVDDLTSQWGRRADALTNQISDVEDADVAETAVQYQQAQQAYTAALTVASQGFRLSLMDFIK